MLLFLIESLVTVFILTYLYFKWSFQTFKRRNVPHIPPTFPFGSSRESLTAVRHFGSVAADQYSIFRRDGHRIGGVYLFSRPTFVVCHPEVVRAVLSKDFAHFNSTVMYLNERDDPLSGHLLALSGQRWKRMRTSLTPTFTSGKMRLMYPLLVECSRRLVDGMKERQGVDVKRHLARFTMNVIGSCAFGLDCEEGSEDFQKVGEQFFSPSFAQRMKGILAFIAPDLAVKLRVRITAQEVEEFFIGVVRDTMKLRRKDGVRRNDFLQQMMEVQERDGLTVEEVSAQSFVFFIAGFETSSTLATLCLYELAKDQTIQDELRREVRAVFEKGDVTYEALHELKFLGCVLEETLRKHPPVLLLARKCTADWRDEQSGVEIKKGEAVMLPIYGMHRDPELFPEPDKFDPSRFSEENRHKIPPYSFIPFGDGPKACIGLRFGLMQARTAVATLVNKFRFTVNEKWKEPFVLDPKSVVNSSKEPIVLDIEEVKY